MNLAATDTASILVSLAVPIVTGTVGAIGLALKDWQQRRNVDHRRRQRLEQAQLELQFIRSWMQAKGELASPRVNAVSVDEWLLRCLKSAEDAAAEMPMQQVRAMRRFFLLVPLHGMYSRTIRMFFWLSLAMLNLWVVNWVYELMHSVDSVVNTSAPWVLFTLVTVGAAGLFHAWCLQADKQEQMPPGPQQPGMNWPPR
ncbi:hypothetical protein ABT024_01605 [Streptomyces sp. NPDC002812]|uniref:hypothetical protein n=1 Tax=Streptomyces sp. NPDC002812 TaxID=3154434 RepID=UPI0033331857